MTVRGTVHSGRREAAGFLAVSWVAAQLLEATGIIPYPGTLNLRLTEASSLAAWREVRRLGNALRLRSPDPAFCDAACFRVLVAGRTPGAVVLPEVEGYPEDVLEIVASERLRDALGLSDGDEVSVTFAKDAP